MESYENNRSEIVDPAISGLADQPVARRRTRILWICFAIVLLAIVVQVILVAIIWKPVLYRISPEIYFAVAMKYTAYNAEKHASNTPSGKFDKALSYLSNGSMDLSFSVEADGQTSNEYTVHTSANRLSKRVFVHATEKSGQQQSELKYYLDKDSTIIDINEDGSHFAYSFPRTDLKDKIAGSAIGQTISPAGLEYLDSFISDSRLITDFVLSGEEMLQPYTEAFAEELSQYPLETEIKEDTVNGKTAKFKVFRYQFTTADLHKLSLSVIDEMEAQGNTPFNKVLVYFLDGVARGYCGITEEPNGLEEAIVNIRRFISELRSELDHSLTLEFYVDGLNVVQATIQLTANSYHPIGDVKLEYTIDPKTGDTVLESSIMVEGTRVNETSSTSTKNENGWIIQTTTTQTRYLGQSTEVKSQIAWNPKSGELQVSDDNKVVSFYLKEGRNNIVFRVDDFSQLLSQLGADTAQTDITGKLSVEFSADTSATKPNAVSILDVKDEDINKFVRSLKKFNPLSGLHQNQNRLIDNANVLSSEYEEGLLKKANKFVNFYEVDLVFVTVEGEDDLAQYADDFYHFNLYGIGIQSSGYIVVFDTASKETVVRSFGKCDQWLDEYYLEQTANEVSQIYAQQGIEFAFDYAYEKIDNDVYPHWISTI